MMLLVRKSALSKYVPHPRFTSASTLNDNTLSRPSAHMAPPTPIAAAGREMPRLSVIHATTGSISEMADVQAANVSNRKKIVPTIVPPGMLPNASGSVTKIRPGPSAGSNPLANTMGNMTSPVIRAMPVSMQTTMIDVVAMETLSGTYAP